MIKLDPANSKTSNITTTNTTSSSGDWTEWSKYVLNQLEDLKTSTENLQESIVKIREQLAVLQVKTSLIAITATILVYLLKLGFDKIIAN